MRYGRVEFPDDSLQAIPVEAENKLFGRHVARRISAQDRGQQEKGDAFGGFRHVHRALRDKTETFLPRLIYTVTFHFLGFALGRQPVDPARFSRNDIISFPGSA